MQMQEKEYRMLDYILNVRHLQVSEACRSHKTEILTLLSFTCSILLGFRTGGEKTNMTLYIFYKRITFS